MNKNEIIEKIQNDELEGEKLIGNFRLILACIYVLCLPIASLLRNIEGYGYFPLRAYIFTTVFLLYSILLFFYFRKKEILHHNLKYILVILDMLIISASIWLSCTYPETIPPIIFLSLQAQLYIMLILIGTYRYSVPCAVFSGIFAGFCYSIVLIANGNTLDLPYFTEYNSGIINFNFPLYNESFRIAAMIVSGIISGIACKHHFKLLNNLPVTQNDTSAADANTVEQSLSMTETIKKSTDEIFHSSKEIFSTANNQAASIQEIESTIRENSQIAAEIAEKTTSVSAIAAKMENDIIHGFDVLERNVGQLGEIKTKNDGLISGIIALGNKITKIRDIIKNIKTITNQTKVIAFNAALEAASAGDRGKRFAVVAGEVNRLADDIAVLTSQIRDNIEEIQSSSSSLIISSEESADKITEGNNLIKELEEIFREIKNGAEITANQAQTITVSTQKQQKSTSQINIAITDISTGLTNFIQSTKIAASSAEVLTQMTARLGELLTGKK